jgi:CSLREA domain-containing protein
MRKTSVVVVLLAGAGSLLLPVSPAHAATILVTTTADEAPADADNSLCSLREAIQASNRNVAVDSCAAGSSVALDTVGLADGAVYQLTKTGSDDSNVGGDLDVFDDDDDMPGDLMGALKITTGTGSRATIQQTVAGQRVLHLDPANASGTVTVTLDKVIVTGGATTSGSGAGILNSGTGLTLEVMFSRISGNQAGTGSSGGGIQSLGPLTVSRSELENNSAANFGGAIFMGASTTFEISQSTVADNDAADGAGIYLNGTSSTIRNVTISGNDAVRHGGGIFVGAGTNVIEFATIYNNRADFNNDTLGDGGGIHRNLGTMHVQGMILAGNTDSGGQAPDCFGNTSTGPTSNGDNLIGDTTGCFFTDNNGDILNPPQGAELGPLEDNGFNPLPTRSHLPLPGSAVVNGADCLVSTGGDQRGMARPQPFDGSCDIGAVEVFFPTDVSDTVKPSSPFSLKRRIKVEWDEPADPTGISFFEVRATNSPYKKAGFSSGELEEFPSTQATTTYRSDPGRDHCFEVRFRNGDLRPSGFGSKACTALPIDDRALSQDGPWRQKRSRGTYLNTYSQSKERGATLEARGAKGIETVALVASKCPGCGKVVVTHGGDVLKRVGLNADSVQKRRLIPIETFANPQGGTFGVTVKSDGKPVRVEGLGLSKN